MSEFRPTKQWALLACTYALTGGEQMGPTVTPDP